MSRRNAFTLAAAAIGLAACTEQNAIGPHNDHVRLTPAALTTSGAVVWADQITGQTGPGSSYSLNVPANWNGKLVVYVHGFVDVAQPVQLPSIAALRDAIGEAGYAVAFSSFSENGFDFKDGLQRTHQLRGLFTSRFGNPAQTMVMGHSLGGLITLALAEKFPDQYNAALPMCGIVGGTRRELQYMGDVRALFDFFYPGVLPGDATTMPLITNLAAQILIPAQTAIVGNPTGAFVIAGIDQTPLPGVTPTEIITSMLTVLGFHARGLDDLTGRAHGSTPYGNAGVTYTSTPYSAFMPAVNSGIGRFTITPQAAQWTDQNYEPSGNLAIPVLTLHTSRDPVAPIFNETILAAKVASAGSSANLLQRTVSRYGHCTFAPSEIVTALSDLAGWVQTGIKPAS